MAELNKIEAIKELRRAWPALFGGVTISLKGAKLIVDTIAPFVVDTNMESAERCVREAQARAECYAADLHNLVRLVDYFVAHPEEYARWKEEK